MDEAVISRYIIKGKDIQISVCPQIDFMSGYLDHYISGMIETVPHDGFDDVKSTISFAASLAVFMPFDGILAFTMSIPLKKRKLFCLFDNNFNSFVARSHFWNAEEFEKDPRLAVQKVSASLKLDHISMVDCKNENSCNGTIESLFHRYLETQDSLRSDFFIRGADFILVRWTKDISEDIFVQEMNDIRKFPEKYINKDNLSEEYHFSFSCGCNSAMMSSMLSRMSGDDIEFVFENGNEVSIECPRCGKNYKIKKDEIKKN